jgi:DNA helicase-2/ATP-dependent DNA helicase PcrA
MTVHSAKGLEFPVVFLAGMEDGIFPSQQNMERSEEMNEERRLAYVAITRAKEKLYITYAGERTIYGRTTKNLLSTFVRNEIPENLTVKEDYTGRPHRYAREYERGYGRSYRDDESAYSDPYSDYSYSGQSYGRRGQSGSNSQQHHTFGRQNVTVPRTDNTKPKTAGAEKYGIEKFTPGTRVNHTTFGDGVIVSARDMGADVLYEVKFDTVGTKKLMATFAKLKKI